MKRGLLFILLAAGFAAQAQQKQSLRDLLYGGKLKADSNTVVRRTDDLSTKIDTATRKPAEPEKPKPVLAAAEPEKKPATTEPASATMPTTPEPTTATTPADSTTTTAAAEVPKAAPVRSNNKIWKDYTDSLVTGLKTEVLPSKKIKKETYYIIADYEIGTDGQVSILNVSATPENTYLQDEIKSRLIQTAPQLAPSIDSTGKARKVKRKYSFSVTKE